MNQSVLECQNGFQTKLLSFSIRFQFACEKLLVPQRKVSRSSKRFVFYPKFVTGNATRVKSGWNFCPKQLQSIQSGGVTSLVHPRHRYKQIFWVSDTCQAATLQNQFGKLSPVKEFLRLCSCSESLPSGNSQKFSGLLRDHGSSQTLGHHFFEVGGY